MGWFRNGARSALEVDARRAHEMVRDGTGVLVDVREQWEWTQGHAPDAKHVPLDGIVARAGELPRDRAVLFICHSGNRSLTAAQYFQQLGYDALSVAGGIGAWAAEGLPVARR